MSSDTTSPGCTARFSNGPNFTSLRALRRAGGEPLPRAAAAQFERPGHAVAAFGMRVLHRRPRRAASPATGLRQPTTTRSFGDGCTATLCGFMLPGMRTCWSDELASTLSGVRAGPSP